MPQKTSAHIRGLGQTYPDGLERKEIWIKKKDAIIFHYQENLRIPIDLRVGKQSYAAGLRTTPKQQIIYICPDLRDSTGKNISLASVLENNGFSKNQEIILEVAGRTVRIIPK
jgi:hypothetical protein